MARHASPQEYGKPILRNIARQAGLSTSLRGIPNGFLQNICYPFNSWKDFNNKNARSSTDERALFGLDLQGADDGAGVGRARRGDDAVQLLADLLGELLGLAARPVADLGHRVRLGVPGRLEVPVLGMRTHLRPRLFRRHVHVPPSAVLAADQDAPAHPRHAGLGVVAVRHTH